MLSRVASQLKTEDLGSFNAIFLHSSKISIKLPMCGSFDGSIKSSKSGIKTAKVCS